MSTSDPLDPPASPPRERRRQARHEGILDVAMQVLLNEGAGALTMRGLASALDLTPGAVYRYFESKDEIIAALGHRTLSAYAEALNAREHEALRAGAKLPADERTLYAALARTWRYWEMSVRDPAGWRLVNLILVEPRQVITGPTHERFMAGVSSQIQRTAALLDSAVAAGSLSPGPAVERALIIFAASNGCLQFLKFGETSVVPFDPALTLTACLRSLFLGWGARPELVERALARAQRDLAAA